MNLDKKIPCPDCDTMLEPDHWETSDVGDAWCPNCDHLVSCRLYTESPEDWEEET